jgi:hypothetical protein
MSEFMGGGDISTWLGGDIFPWLLQRPSKLAPKNYLCYIAYRTNTAKKLINFLYKDAKMFLDRKYTLAIQCAKIQIRTRHNQTAIYE